MSKPKEYKLKTLEDIIKAVSEESAQNFIRDFASWLSFRIGIEKEIKNLPEGVEIEKNYTMLWIDDGKNEGKITITIENKT